MWCKPVYCPDFGVPQSRRRLVLMASLLGEINLETTTCGREGYPTVRSTIGDLPPIAAGECDTEDLLHKSSTLSDDNLLRIRSSKPGGTWRDWDKSLRSPCHRKAGGKTYPGVYGRMEWDKVAPTVTTQFHTFGTGRFGHPEQDRALSLREGARLQTFPDTYRFVDMGQAVLLKGTAKLIGNALPTELAAAIGRHIVNHLETHL